MMEIIDLTKRATFTEEISKYIKENISTVHYNDMVVEIKERYGVLYTPKQLGGRANNMGLKQFSPKQYDRNFFEKIDTPEKAYWLGFIYADGWVCLTDVNAELGIELAAIDEPHLHKFKEALGANSTKIVTAWKTENHVKSLGRTIRATETSKIRLYSKNLVEDLISHGVHLRKTYEEKSPDFKYSEDINLAIIRGFYDGDGGVDINGQVKFTAYRKEFLLKLQDYLYSRYGVEGRVFKETRSEDTYIHRFTIHSSSAERFLSILYKDLNYTYLERKHKRFKSYY